MEDKNKNKVGGNNQQPPRLTYDELKKLAGDLSQQNQQMMGQIRQMRDALERRDFDYTSFFLSMLFKVMEHPEMYKDTFVKWASESIEEALSSFAKALSPEKPQETERPADEA